MTQAVKHVYVSKAQSKLVLASLVFSRCAFKMVHGKIVAAEWKNGSVWVGSVRVGLGRVGSGRVG